MYAKRIPQNAVEKYNLGEIAKNFAMSEVQNLSEITPSIPFTEFNFYDLYLPSEEELRREIERQKEFFQIQQGEKNS